MLDEEDPREARRLKKRPKTTPPPRVRERPSTGKRSSIETTSPRGGGSMPLPRGYHKEEGKGVEREKSRWVWEGNEGRGRE